jgi:hypothetical protein
MKFILVCLFSVSVLPSCTSMQSKPVSSFPMPEAEKDFKQLALTGVAMAKKHGRTQETLRKLALPFAPLDISSPGRMAKADLRQFRNLYFGFLGRAFNANPLQMSREYFCSRECWAARNAATKLKIDKIKDIVSEFQALEKVSLISQWEMEGRFRVNNFFVSDNGLLEPAPSVDFGLVPSGIWKKTDAEIPQRPVVEKLVRKMVPLHIIALLRSVDGSVSAVLDGFADNSYGVLVLAPEKAEFFSPDPSGQWMEIGKGVWIFSIGGREYSPAI